MSITAPAAVSEPAPASDEVRHLRDLSPSQWKSGIAAWLGWLFDGLDIHLYTLVATPFVAELLRTTTSDPAVGYYGSWIQAAFLMGWAVGGAIFGRIGDCLGRSRALVLTILTYAIFTGLSFFATEWWHLFIFRFLAALGIGGEWAVGASLLSETWPRRWRPWIAAVLQAAVNIGILLASVAAYLLAAYPNRYVFLVGIVPALLVLCIRKAVPETEEWQAARDCRDTQPARVADLFRGDVRRITLLTVLVCALSLTAHWAFMFWFAQHLRNLPDVAAWSATDKSKLVGTAMTVLMIASLGGNFVAAAFARWTGYRWTIAGLCLAYFLAMAMTYSAPRPLSAMWYALPVLGVCSGVFALFTMYMPPLFPTLLRTTGAGFCYNIGRVVAALGTVLFGLFTEVGDYRLALYYASFLFLPATVVALFLPEPPHEPSAVAPVE